MVGTVLFGLLDVRYMRTLLLYAKRADRIEQVIASEQVIAKGYLFRPADPGGPPWLTWLERRYGSPILFYVIVLLLLLLLWIVSLKGRPSAIVVCCGIRCIEA